LAILLDGITMNRDLVNFNQSNELEYIQRYAFNNFNGAQIARDLREYPQLWQQAWMSGSFLGGWEDEAWCPDSLNMVTMDADSASRLIELGVEWRADDGLSAQQVPDGAWLITGWWD
jgi:hypothetical protein